MSGFTKAVGYLFSIIGILIAGLGVLGIYLTDLDFLPLFSLVLMGMILILIGAVVEIGGFVKEHKAYHKKMEEKAYLQRVQNTVMQGYDRYGLKRQAG